MQRRMWSDPLYREWMKEISSLFPLHLERSSEAMDEMRTKDAMVEMRVKDAMVESETKDVIQSKLRTRWNEKIQNREENQTVPTFNHSHSR